ncbi:3473_t:CDS:2 [Funneliformis geosporum]|nr:3473_t:CDS:2 [Funneliformis geosporum]
MDIYISIHFKTENNAGLFYQRVQGKTFKFDCDDNLGETKTILIEFSPTTDISTDTPTDTSQQVTSQPAPQQVTSSQTS